VVLHTLQKKHAIIELVKVLGCKASLNSIVTSWLGAQTHGVIFFA